MKKLNLYFLLISHLIVFGAKINGSIATIKPNSNNEYEVDVTQVSEEQKRIQEEIRKSYRRGNLAEQFINNLNEDLKEELKEDFENQVPVNLNNEYEAEIDITDISGKRKDKARKVLEDSTKNLPTINLAYGTKPLLTVASYISVYAICCGIIYKIKKSNINKNIKNKLNLIEKTFTKDQWHKLENKNIFKEALSNPDILNEESFLKILNTKQLEIVYSILKLKSK